MTLQRLDNGEIFFGEAKWTPEDNIDCLVKVEETGEVIPFCATPFDPEDYGRELYEMLKTKYADMVQPCTDEERYRFASGDVLMRRGQELASSDWISNGDVMLQNQLEWLQYRQDLRDITLQDGYPFDVTWPTRPQVTYSTPVDDRVRALARNE